MSSIENQWTGKPSTLIELELELVEHFVRHMSGPLQEFNFLAKRLMYQRKGDKSILLGSPVYVALAN